jgi:UMF1 family MFS transporter
VSAQYGKDELTFADQVLIVTILVIQFVAYFGGVLHGIVAKRFGAKGRSSAVLRCGSW